MTAPQDEREAPGPAIPTAAQRSSGLPSPRHAVFDAWTDKFGQKFGTYAVPKWNSILDKRLTPMPTDSGIMKSPLSREYSMQVALFKQL